ncbi:MAG TPA: hypothetical protein VIX91_03315 [Candidatus Acidoferrum sp.]
MAETEKRPEEGKLDDDDDEHHHNHDDYDGHDHDRRRGHDGGDRAADGDRGWDSGWKGRMSMAAEKEVNARVASLLGAGIVPKPCHDWCVAGGFFERSAAGKANLRSTE